MKNRFGFIPIVLPVLVMVLIIGLINLTGPQTAQAQGNDEDAQLSELSLSVGSLTPDFKPGVANYTATVDYTVGEGNNELEVKYTLPLLGNYKVKVEPGNKIKPKEGVTKITITVTEDVSAPAVAKTATYVITLTKLGPDIDADGPRLDTNGLMIGSVADNSLNREYGGTGFDPGLAYYTASVDYTVQSVIVTATDSGVNDVTDITISPASSSIDTTPDDDKNHRVPLSVGDNEITVSTKAIGSKATYTVVVTREDPVVDDIKLGNATLVPSFKKDSDIRAYKATVGFEVDSVTVDAVVNTLKNDSKSRRILKSIKPEDADASTKDDHDVSLTSGETTTIVIQVEHWLKDIYDSTKGASSTGEYRVNVKREHPKLASEAGLVLKYGAADTSSTDKTDGIVDGLRPAYNVDVTAYEAPIPYQHGFVTINPKPQKESPPDDTVEAVLTGLHRTDARPGINGYQVELEPGVTKTVTVRARSTDKPLSAKTDYTIALTRGATPLDELALCEGAENNCKVANPSKLGSGEIALTPPGTSTPAAFDPAITTYTAVVDYAVDSTTVVGSNDEPVHGREIGFTRRPIVTSSKEIVADLVVGDNAIAVWSGVPGNTTTYEVTVKRNAPTPSLRFVLLDENGERLGEGIQKLDLAAQTRNYTFDDEDVVNAESFDDDDLILLRSLRVYTDKLDTGVRVSYAQITVEDASAPLPIPSLPEGDFTLEFEVRYKTGMGDEEDFTTHRISFNRPVNSQPAFPANAALRGQQFVLLHDVRFRPDGTNTVIELPYATGGDVPLMYELIGNEAKGTSEELPSDLDYVKPKNSPNTDGEVTGVPKILDASDAAVHHLILRVSDSDAISGSIDEDTIEFSIRIVRDADQVTPDPVQKPDLAELFGIEVMYDDPVTTDEVEDIDAVMKPKFDPDRRIYTATVPTDVDEVDIHITASSSAAVIMNETGAPEKMNNVTTDFGTGTRHEWNGHKLFRGRVITVPNRYTIDVSDGGVDLQYTLDVVREDNTEPTFTDQIEPLKYYEGIDVGVGGSALKAVTLPRPLKIDGGNGATTSWEYSLERRLSTAPSGAKTFLGLEFDDDPSKRTLSGTPQLDTNDAQNRLSDHSEVYVEYAVHDYDLDKSASDKDTLDGDIFVYRNATLRSLTVDGDRVDLSENQEVLTYRDSRLYSYKAEGGNYIAEYTQSLAHDATMATISAQPYPDDSSEIEVTYSAADADSDTDGIQVSVSKGDNPVTITVSNATISVRHVINLSVPGLEALMITVLEDEDARPGGAQFLDNLVKLEPIFDRRTRNYTAMVETWVRSVRVSADPVDPRAQVQVNDFALPNADGYRVVNLPNMDDTPNSITVGIHLGDSTPVLYAIDITRKSDTSPAFPAGEVEDKVCMVNKSIKYPIQLPKATGGNGAPTYVVIEEELPPGLRFDAGKRQIVGTPRLDEGYSSDFEVTYSVADADGNKASSDGDTGTFVITITNDPDAPCSQPDPQDPAVDPADRNTLSDLIVTYDKGATRDIVVALAPSFEPRSGGPYTANVPPDATNIQVTTVPAVTETRITINNTRIAGGEKLNLPPVATIVVSHAALADTMSYTLNTVRESDTAPEFSDVIEAMVFNASVAIEDPIRLPMASGGNGVLAYSLMDHQGVMPEGLMFNAETRELSGAPALLRDSVKTVYRMTYTATDAQNESDSLSFMLTVCDPAQVSDCLSTMVTNPGSTPIDLTVRRDGTSATIDWTPGDDTASQLVVALMASDVNGTLKYDSVGGDVDTYTFSDLQSGVYLFAVIGIDANGGYGTPGNYFVARIMQ